jgi:DNA-binding NarL/FixJ family response regulator
MIRILIVEDQNFPRKAINAILETEKNLMIVGEAKNGVEALELIEGLAIDLALVDLNLPGMDGFELTKKITQSSPTKVVILSGNDDRNSIGKAINCGARGYLLKNEFTKEELIDTIDRVHRGYFQLAPGIFEKLFNNAIDYQSETIEKLSLTQDKLQQTFSTSLPKENLPLNEEVRQQLFSELKTEIDNLKLELGRGLNKFQDRVSQQIENDLKELFRDSQQSQFLEDIYRKQHKKLTQNIDYIENNINIIESKYNFSVNKLKQELAILRYSIIFIVIVLAPILLDYFLRN